MKFFLSILRSYRFKLGITFAVLLLAATSVSLFLVYNQTKPLLLSQMGSRLQDIGHTATHLFGDKEFEAIEKVQVAIVNAQKLNPILIPPAQPGEYRPTLSDEAAGKIIKMPEFQFLVALLRRIKNSTTAGGKVETVDKEGSATQEAKPTLAFVSLFLPASSDSSRSVAQFIADSDYDHSEVPAPPGNLLFNNSPALAKAFAGSGAADPDFRFEQGMHILTAAIPLKDRQGKQKAILSLYYDAHGEVNFVNRLAYQCTLVVICALIVSVFCSMFVTWFLTRDIRTLRLSAEKVRDKDFSVAIDLKRTDELGVLAQSFNDMVKEIRHYAGGLEETNTAYSKFVPRQILEFLGQKSITHVRLGDQVQRQMTVLFADIRSFTTISESMSPRDNFDFINEYLKTIGPIIRKHNGFIDKYIGDAIMALFPDKPDDAVRAAIEMHHVLEDFNREGKEKGRPSIQIGVGVHRGNLMLGTVGEEQRMEGTVISDAVNLTSRLEGLTKNFGAGIIISEAVLDAIQGERRFTSRCLGETKVKGKRRSVRIYEVIEGSEVESAHRKAISIKEFERGIKAFEKEEYSRALRYFVSVLRGNRNDMAARHYITRCKECLPARSSVKGTVIPVDEERFQKKI